MAKVIKKKAVASKKKINATSVNASSKKKVAVKKTVEKPIKKATVKVKQSADKKTAIKKAAIKKTAVKKPAVKKTAVKKPAVKKPAVKKPAVKKTEVKKPAVKKIAVKTPAVKKPAANNVAAKKPVVKKSPLKSLTTIKIKPISVEKQKTSPVVMTTEKPKNVGVPASISHKKRLVVSYSNMSKELTEAFRQKYPRGYSDYMGDLFKVDKPDGTSFYAISMETSDSVFLIKMIVKIDDYDDMQSGLFPDPGGEQDGPAEGETFPDDNTDSIADADDEADE